MKVCAQCGREKRNESFQAGPGVMRSMCKTCRNEDRRYKRSIDPEYRAAERRSRNKSYAVRSKKIFSKLIEGYGGKCVKCGEDRPIALLLHHPNGIVGERKSGSFYYKSLIDSGFPNTVELLCGTCHLIHHREEREE